MILSIQTKEKDNPRQFYLFKQKRRIGRQNSIDFNKNRESGGAEKG